MVAVNVEIMVAMRRARKMGRNPWREPVRPETSIPKGQKR